MNTNKDTATSTEKSNKVVYGDSAPGFVRSKKYDVIEAGDVAETLANAVEKLEQACFFCFFFCQLLYSEHSLAILPFYSLFQFSTQFVQSGGRGSVNTLSILMSVNPA